MRYRSGSHSSVAFLKEVLINLDHKFHEVLTYTALTQSSVHPRCSARPEELTAGNMLKTTESWAMTLTARVPIKSPTDGHFFAILESPRTNRLE